MRWEQERRKKEGRLSEEESSKETHSLLLFAVHQQRLEEAEREAGADKSNKNRGRREEAEPSLHGWLKDVSLSTHEMEERNNTIKEEHASLSLEMNKKCGSSRKGCRFQTTQEASLLLQERHHTSILESRWKKRSRRGLL